jgi:hypothetical protein
MLHTHQISPCACCIGCFQNNIHSSLVAWLPIPGRRPCQGEAWRSLERSEHPRMTVTVSPNALGRLRALAAAGSTRGPTAQQAPPACAAPRVRVRAGAVAAAPAPSERSRASHAARLAQQGFPGAPCLLHAPALHPPPCSGSTLAGRAAFQDAPVPACTSWQGWAARLMASCGRRCGACWTAVGRWWRRT